MVIPKSIYLEDSMGIVTTSYLEMRKKEILDECKFFPLSDEATKLRKRIAEVDMVDTDRGLEQIARISLEFSMLGHKSEDLDDVLKYFDVMCENERNLVKEWYEEQFAKTGSQLDFLSVVGEAIGEIEYNYLIANIEPSVDQNGKIFYKEKCKVGIYLESWDESAEEFLPEHGSSLATLYELFLWYAYRIAKGFWSLEYVCDDSRSAGNYYYAPASSNRLELSGERIVGGARDGVGNTQKIVKQGEDYYFCGGSYSIYFNYPVAKKTATFMDFGLDATGVVVLRK